MNFQEFFKPVNINKELNIINLSDDSWVKNVDIHDKNFPNMDNRKIVLIGIVSERYPYEANHIRSFLYSLKKKEYAQIVADLGNFEVPDDHIKHLEKLGYILSELQNLNLVPVIIGPPQEVSYSQYLSYEYLKKYANFVSIDATIDFNITQPEKMTSDNYLYRILLRDPSYLFNLSLLGYQTYLADSESISTMERYFFETYRLGKIRENIQEIEPIIRSADIMSFDISSVRQCDAAGSNHPSPNGFTAEDACLICRYAGLSDNLNSIGFYEYNSITDNNGQTSFLIAEMIWYFVDGYLQRQYENIVGNPKNFTKFITSDVNNTFHISFYKSKKTNRWWMEVPGKSTSKILPDKQFMPCSYKDYEDATKGGIPERWFKAFKKLNN